MISWLESRHIAFTNTLWSTSIVARARRTSWCLAMLGILGMSGTLSRKIVPWGAAVAAAAPATTRMAWRRAWVETVLAVEQSKRIVETQVRIVDAR